jgi:hypothetical protein
MKSATTSKLGKHVFSALAAYYLVPSDVLAMLMGGIGVQ